MKKYYFLCFLLGAAAFTSCNNNEPQVKEMTAQTEPAVSRAEKNRGTVVAMLEAINKHDLNTAFQSCAPDFKEYGDGSTPPMPLDSLRGMLQAWLTAFPDYRGSDFTYAAEDNVVMVWGKWSGTWNGAMMGQQPTGKQFMFADVDILKFNNQGQVTEHHNIVPFSEIARQVGMKMH